MAKVLFQSIHIGSSLILAGSVAMTIDEQTRWTSAGGVLLDDADPYIASAAANARAARSRGANSLVIDQIMAGGLALRASSGIYSVDAALLSTMSGIDGTVIFTSPPRGMRLVLRSGAFTADGIRYFASATTGKFWVRDTSYGSAGAADQATWHVRWDGGGNDANDGTSYATALATLDELDMRLSGQQIIVPMTVNCYGTSPPFAQRFAPTIRNGPPITLQGVRDYTGADTGSISITAWNSATKTIASLTRASGSWASLVGKPLELTNRPGVIAWVTRDAGGGVADSNGPITAATGITAAVSASEPYTSYTMARATRLYLAPKGHGSMIVSDLDIGELDGGDAGITYTGCRIGPMRSIAHGSSFSGCHFWYEPTFYEPVVLTGCSSQVQLFVKEQATFDGPCLVAPPTSGHSSLIVLPGGAANIIGALASVGGAYTVIHDGTQVYVQGGYLWGKDAGTGIGLLRGGRLFLYTAAGNLGYSGSAPPHLWTIGGTVPSYSDTLPFPATTSAGGFNRDTI